MSYKLEGKDIVLGGIEEGIADTPYAGIGDMRNINILTMLGEGSTQLKETPATLPPVLNNIAFTASASTNRLTWAGPNTLYESAAISLSLQAVDYLVQAGGGGAAGGSVSAGGGGGGGAGGRKTGSMSMAPGIHAITVGAGGAGGAAATNGTIGSNSSIAALVVSTGGGRGGTLSTNGGNGGSGGGGGGRDGGTPVTTGGTGIAGQGFDGGGQTSNSDGAGGGGGAGGIGGSSSNTVGGVAGIGAASSISGASVTYGVGGAGGGFGSGNGAAGTANRGNGGTGGGGSSGTGGNGGSGIVIISYPTGTITATGGSITTSGGNTIHSFTTSGSFEITAGLNPDTVYYVRNIVGSTFQLSIAPGLSTIVDITGDFSGTFTTYQYGNQRGLGDSTTTPPISYIVDRNRTNGIINGIYLTDLSNYVWGLFPAAISVGSNNIPANTLVFLGNIGGAGAAGTITSGVNIWVGYIFLFGPNGSVDLADLNDLFTSGGPAVWDYGWWSSDASNVNGKTSTLVGQDNVLYFISGAGVGSIIQIAGQTFDPTDSATYTRNIAALAIPSYDSSTCLAELGVNLLVGGQNSSIYPWDRVSTSFTYPIIIPDNFTVNIIGTNQNAYIFAGNRGRIYITNGSSVDEYQKMPDYVTGIINPYYRWRDASFARNQLYFTFTATTNADVALTSVNGAWGIDLKTDALYMVNKITNSGYAGTTSMAVEMPSASQSDQPAGTALVLGWNVSGTYGIDVGSSAPYDNLESFIEFDFIPVGTYTKPFTPLQIEWKMAAPLGGGGTIETIRLLYRLNITDSFTLLGTTSAIGTTVTGSTTGVSTNSGISDYYQANFQKAQWVQFRAEMSSNATTPTYCRLTEVRIREYPSQ